MTYILLATALLLASYQGNAMTPLDTTKYFSSPAVAAFVDDVQRGNTARVKAALAAGISPNAAGVKGFRPIHFVFGASDADSLRLLLAAGADPMARLENGNTPLHFAARMPNPDFVRLLLAAGADPNAAGAYDKPVIVEALGSQSPEVLRVLAQGGANINNEWGGSTPLISAIVTSSWDMAVTLLDLHADLSFRDRAGDGAVEEFCAKARKVVPTPTNRKGIPALNAAFKRRGVAVPCEAELQKFR